MYCSISSNNCSLCTYSHLIDVSNIFPKLIILIYIYMYGGCAATPTKWCPSPFCMFTFERLSLREKKGGGGDDKPLTPHPYPEGGGGRGVPIEN